MKNTIKRILFTVAIPVLTYLFFMVICNIKEPGCGFGIGSDFVTIIYNTTYTGMSSGKPDRRNYIRPVIYSFENTAYGGVHWSCTYL